MVITSKIKEITKRNEMNLELIPLDTISGHLLPQTQSLSLFSKEHSEIAP